MLKDPSAQRASARLAGILIAVMIALVIGHGLFGLPRWPAGVAAWSAAILLARRLPSTQAWQIGAIVTIGFVSLAYAISMGGRVALLPLLDANVGLLTMIGSVSFLRLVALPDRAKDSPDPRGPRAFRDTMLGVALFGAFINISAPILIADHLSRERRLRLFEARSLTRVFSGCPAWSPFFGGMAVVLTLVPGMHLFVVMAAGLPFAVAGLVFVIAEARLRRPDDIEQFDGYPISSSSLFVPALLAACVSLGYGVLDGVSVLVIIAVSALVVTAAVLLVRRGPNGARRALSEHVQFGLPGMSGELFLFLAAGVLAVGLRAAFSVAQITLPFDAFGPSEAAIVLMAMIAVSAVGAHPVMFIAVVTPLIMPLAPAPDLLAVTYLLGWSLGTCASPLSGTHLIFQGRYGISSIQGARQNWSFVLAMTAMGVALLHGFPLA